MLRRCVRSWRRACEARIIRIRERFACGHSACAASSGSGATDESIRDYQEPRFADSSCLYF
jgi:hypothetical protein